VNRSVWLIVVDVTEPGHVNILFIENLLKSSPAGTVVVGRVTWSVTPTMIQEVTDRFIATRSAPSELSFCPGNPNGPESNNQIHLANQERHQSRSRY
jgi:hypothetical protein